MEILLDEDVPLPLSQLLQRLLLSHTITHAQELGWKGKKDSVVFRDARQRGFAAIVTNDKGQLNDPQLCDAIRRAGIHHIRYAQLNGIEGLARAAGAVVAALPAVVRHLEQSDGQRLVQIRAIDPRDRFISVDPRRHPPPYWKN
jgi:predicted nuclease of predicted toxin-antitoxin system